MSEWRDIATAPKDGTRMLLYVPDEDGSDYVCQIGRWDYISIAGDDFQWFYDGDKDNARYCAAHPPTHWMPLPEPPQ